MRDYFAGGNGVQRYDLDLSDARANNNSQFTLTASLPAGILKEGARPVETDPEIVVSPCDAIVGASGAVNDGQILQVKGLPYAIDDLLGDSGRSSYRYRERVLCDSAA